ncbi:MAG: cell division protein FtsQ/DivIB [Pseudomonadota bacterium]
MRAVSALVGRRWPGSARFGPGPSKLAYRLRRTWAIPAVRACCLVYLPIAAFGLVGWRLAADDGIRRAVEAQAVAAWEAVVARPEFRLSGVVITGAEERLRAEIHKTLSLPVGQSTLRVDVDVLREKVEALGGVREASVSLDPAGLLAVEVTPRPAVALWRDGGEQLYRVAVDGTIIAPVSRRAAHPVLPVLIGAGALAAVDEALALLEAAPPMRERLRAFVRIGERRWDLHLGGERVIMLPADEPETALARVMALHYGEEILDRDVARIDMRLPERPTLRLPGEAIETMRLRRTIASQKAEDL